MTLETGAIAYWRDFDPGCDKFIYILGTNAASEVLSFTISSQTKYLAMEPHAKEMVEIPRGSIDCLPKTSFIQCFYEVRRTPIHEFRELERLGYISYRATAPQFAIGIFQRVKNSELLDGYDKEAVLEVLKPLAEPARD